MGRPSVPPVDELKPSGDPLTFLQPSPPPTASPSDLPMAETFPQEGQEAADPWSSGLDESAGDVRDEASPDPTSSRASSGPEQEAAGLVIRELTRKGVLAAGEVAHESLARDEAARYVGLWLTDDVDAENIGDPLARIINRHNPVSDITGDTDAADGIAALAGLAVYAFRQFDRWRGARRLRRVARVAAAQAAAAGEAGDVPAEPVEPAAAAPAPSWPPTGL